MYSTIKFFSSQILPWKEQESECRDHHDDKIIKCGVTDLLGIHGKALLSNKKAMQNMVLGLSYLIPGMLTQGKHCIDSLSAVH